MSNSDKEFEGWFKGMSYKHHYDVRKEVWNHLYPYKERCEKLEESGWSGLLAQANFKIKTLEAKVKELEGSITQLKNYNRQLEVMKEGVISDRESLEAKIKELEEELNGYRHEDKYLDIEAENKTLEAQLEVLTKCSQFEEGDGDCINWFPDKINHCQGCKNKKLLEGVKSE